MQNSSQIPQNSDFARDVLGRYVCNGLDEALKSAPLSTSNPLGSMRPEARDFDLVVIGGGTFGAALAEHLWFRDAARAHRILVLEAGPFLLPEHVQNVTITQLDVADKTSIQKLRQQGQFGWDKPQREVWGLPWHSNQEFPGLAYCVGGRSLYWGGWSPELLHEETQKWPTEVVQALRERYFDEASAQIGVTETNDFIFGDLQTAMRERLAERIGDVTDAMDIASDKLLDHPAVRYAGKTSRGALEELLGVRAGTSTLSESEMRARLKLEAPLAVQGRSGHAGYFPFNKFSSVPSLMKATRAAHEESIGASGQADDVYKRLMIVPFCNVFRLDTVRNGIEWRVQGIQTNLGYVPVPSHGKVVVAMATLESTRLALNSFGEIHADAYARIGRNFTAHLRSNLSVRVPREALGLPEEPEALHAAALFVKGRHEFTDGEGGTGFFHLQISASGGKRGVGSEAELFKKIPDIDTLAAHLDPSIPDTHVAITIRGIGEMQPQNDRNRVRLDPEIEQETGVNRVFVSIDDPQAEELRAHPKVARDFELWEAMDQAAKDVAVVFGATEVPDPVPDTLGTTHHESGTLWMGDTADSVTDPNCKFRHVRNAYAIGPALFPTIGSPNPMLTGIALSRRLGDHLASPIPFVAEDGFTAMFDGIQPREWEMPLDWQMTTIRNQPGKDYPGAFRIVNSSFESLPGKDMGVFWYKRPMPTNYILRLQWLRWTETANSGIYVRFPHPDSKGYDNTAYVADDFGFEVQIDEYGDLPVHRTGAVYRKDNRTDGEALTLRSARPVGEWNDYEIRVEGDLYTVLLNGDTVCVFDNDGLYPHRGLYTSPGYVGLQCYSRPDARVAFRNIRYRALP